MDPEDRALLHTTLAEATAAGTTSGVFRALQERVKELSALHAATQVLQDDALTEDEALRRIAGLLPSAFFYADDAACRIVHAGRAFESDGFRDTPWKLRAPFRTGDGREGAIEVVYSSDRPASGAGPFLPEERRLLDSLAAMVAGAIDRRAAHERLTLALSKSVRHWDWNIPQNRITWPDLHVGDPPRALHLSFDEMIAHVHPDDRDDFHRNVEATLHDPARQDRLVLQCRIAYPGPDYQWRHLTARLVRDPAGRPLRMLGLSTDITEQRNLQDRLRQSEKMEALGRLAGGIAHDFNNILVAVLGFGQLAQEQLPPGHPVRGHVDEIVKAGDTAKRLVQQIVAFSRRQELKPSTIDLRAALAEWEGMIRRLLGSRHAIKSHVGPDTPAVRADPTQLFQVVLNLSINARDAMPGGGDISVRTSGRRAKPPPNGSTAPEADWAVVEVQDAGTGMPPEILRHIFEPFFTTKEAGKGTGMGLATVHGIVMQSGGFLEVESEVGKGTLFRIYLPAVTS